MISRGRSPGRASPKARCNAPCAEYPYARDNSKSTACQRRHWPAYTGSSAEAYVRAPRKGRSAFLPARLTIQLKLSLVNSAPRLRIRTRTPTSDPAPCAASAAPVAFVAADRMPRRPASLLAFDVHLGRIEVDIGPFQLDDLRRPEAMPEGNQDHSRIPMTVTIALSGLDQLYDTRPESGIRACGNLR